MPSRPLPFLYRLARVQQEDRSYLFFLESPCQVDRCCSCTALLVSTKRTAAICFPGEPMPSRPLLYLHRLAIQVHTEEHAIQVHTQERAIQVHTQNVLSKCTLRTCHPSAHSERAIQVHTQERTIQVHTQERAIQVHTQNVLSKCTLRTCYPSAHSECAIKVHTQEHAIQVETQNMLSKCTVYSCTAHAPLRNLVHLSCTIGSRTTLVHCSRAPLTSFLNCRGTFYCLAVGSPTQEASSTILYHSNTHNSHC